MSKNKQLYLFAVFMVLYEFTTYAANDMIMPGMIKVITEFNVGAYYIALSVICYILGNAILTPLVGPLSERYGNRRIILIGATFFVISTAFMVVTRNISQFLIIRVFEGIGLSVIAAGYSLIHKNFNDVSAVKLTAFMGNVAILAPLIGPMIGATIISYFDWRAIFYITVILALIALIGLFKYIPKTSTSIKPNSMSFRTSFIEYSRVFKNKNFVVGVIIMALSGISFVEWIGFSPAVILYKLHRSYMAYTIYQLIALGGVSTSSIIMQFISGRIEFAKLLRVGLYCTILAIIINLAVFFVSNQLDFLALGFFVFGFGGGLINGIIMRIMVSDKNALSNYTMASVIFVQMMLMMVVLNAMNHIISVCNYSLNILSLLNIICWILSGGFLIKFIYMNKDRNWQ